jgi:hypothetical protein
MTYGQGVEHPAPEGVERLIRTSTHLDNILSSPPSHEEMEAWRPWIEREQNKGADITSKSTQKKM